MRLKVKDMILVALFAALMIVGAFIKIPFPYVPLTFQPFFCAFAGILLGSRLGALSQIVYVAMGLVGIPVFTAGGGLTYVFKPSFGYLLGFIAGAYVIGKISETLREVNLRNAIFSLAVGLIVIYAIGIPYTYLIMKFYMNKPDAVFVAASIVPFIIKDLVLFIVIAVTTCGIMPALKRAGLARG